jgi:hypothetical protein
MPSNREVRLKAACGDQQGKELVAEDSIHERSCLG